MRYSGIGGQAVMEGVMMKNQEKYAVAVRKPDQEIVVDDLERLRRARSNSSVWKKHADLVRGVVSFIDSSGAGDVDSDVSRHPFFEDEEEEEASGSRNSGEACRSDKTGSRRKKSRSKRKSVRRMRLMGGAVAISIVHGGG